MFPRLSFHFPNLNLAPNVNLNLNLNLNLLRVARGGLGAGERNAAFARQPLSRRDIPRIAPDLLIPWKMAEPIPDTTNEVYTP